VILDEIVAHKRQEVARQRQAVPLAELRARAARRHAPLDFAAALRGPPVRLIAEVKRASPSRGTLRPDLDPVRLARTYADNGAAAISVLTDPRFFQGDLVCLARIREALGTTIPLLRKDFVLDPYQVHESYAWGADAVLLIAAILPDDGLAALCALVEGLGMTAMVEVHNEEETQRVVRLHPRLVGVNNRNLRDFRVDLDTFGRLRPLFPPGVVAVAESGIRSAADVRRAVAMGADAVLVGEALVTAADVAAMVHELVVGGAG